MNLASITLKFATKAAAKAFAAAAAAEYLLSEIEAVSVVADLCYVSTSLETAEIASNIADEKLSPNSVKVARVYA